MKLFYRTIGSGPPLIILHGLFGSSDNWMSVSKLFGVHYQVYLLDARNHGQSPHDEVHTYSSMADDLEEFIFKNALDSLYIIGHSMGGKTVMEYLTSKKNTVSKAVIVDISPRAYEPHHHREIQALKSINLAELSSRQEADDIMARIIPELGVRQFLLKNLYRNEDGSFHWRMNLDGIIYQINEIGKSTPKSSISDADILFLKGSKSDYYIRPEDEVLIKKIFPKSKIKIIENSGHWIQAEQPQAFFETVFSFFTK